MADPDCSIQPNFQADLETRIYQISDQGSEHGDLAKSIWKLLLGAGSVVGDDFFAVVSTQLAEVLGADFIFVGRLCNDGKSVHTLAACHEQTLIDNIVYELKDTPCQETVSRASCTFQAGVAGQFPKDEILVEQKAEGYAGTALFNSEGEAIGLIAAVYLKPIPDSEFASTILMAIASRAAAEIERQIRDESQRQLETQILSSQKLESLGILAGGLAHDFNNILATILGSADLAELDLELQSPARKNINVIQTAATSAGELCKQLLAYAGKGRFELVNADLGELVRSQVEFLRSATHKSAQIKFELADDLPTCEADLSQLQQILLNLVINASEALHGATGTITVSTGVKELDRATLNQSEIGSDCPAGEYVYLEVSDTGFGMEEGVRSKLFDPFFTTKSTGRGLGLSAILGIVRGHKGWIHVDSQPKLGSRFTVYLPANHGDPVVLSEEKLDSDWVAEGKALLVDDDLDVLQVTAAMLERVGFDVIPVDSGFKALEVFAESNHELAVVILDLTMPNMTGDEVFKRMQQINPKVPVILTSGFNEQDTVQKFAGSGLAGFLQKPTSLSQMKGKIRLVMESELG